MLWALKRRVPVYLRLWAHFHVIWENQPALLAVLRAYELFKHGLNNHV